MAKTSYPDERNENPETKGKEESSSTSTKQYDGWE